MAFVNIALVIATLTLVYCIHKIVALWNVLNVTGNNTGRIVAFGPDSLLGNVVPMLKGISLGMNFVFMDKHDPFARTGHDIEFVIILLPRPKIQIFVADPSAIKEILSTRTQFPKPLERYTILSFFGPNILVSEADDWKKYRKISAPSFSERNNKMVWYESAKIMDSLFDDVWESKSRVEIEDAIKLTIPFSLFVIGVAGFGQNMSWTDNPNIPPTHKMTFKQALHIATSEFVPKLFLPEWSLGLTKSWRNCRDGFDELRLYMKEMVRDRLASGSLEDRHDLFSSLVESNSDRETPLNEDEILGNIYIFLVAGHETTAHALAFALALLALHEKEQDELYAHITTLVTPGHTPAYEEMDKFTRVLAVIYETMRLFPPVSAVPKAATADTVLYTTTDTGESVAIPVPSGTHILIHIVGLHYNPRYWDDPHEFKPERFLKPWNKDAFIPFSGGARSCMGRKFAETEMIVALIKLISNYKVSIKEEPQFATETLQEKKARVLKATQLLTVTPVRIPLVFTRRA